MHRRSIATRQSLARTGLGSGVSMDHKHSMSVTRREALHLLATGAATLATTRGISAPGPVDPKTMPTPLHTRRIPSSGETLPVIGLGTWQTFDVGSSPAERAPLEGVLGAFVALGGKVI